MGQNGQFILVNVLKIVIWKLIIILLSFLGNKQNTTIIKENPINEKRIYKY